MQPHLIESILRANSHRVTLFIADGTLTVYGADAVAVQAVFQPGDHVPGGLAYSDNLSHTIQRLLNQKDYRISVYEERN